MNVPRQQFIVCPYSDNYPITFLSQSQNSIEKLFYMFRFRIDCEERP